MTGWISWRRLTGEPIHHGPYHVTPISGHLAIRLPYFRFVWSRPLAVEVVSGAGRYTLRIRDVTRRAQVGLWTLGFAASATIWLARRSRRGAQESGDHP